MRSGNFSILIWQKPLGMAMGRGMGFCEIGGRKLETGYRKAADKLIGQPENCSQTAADKRPISVR